MKYLFLTLLLCISAIGLSANRYWIAGSASNWNNTANWSTSSGGAGGASVPVAGDVAIFDGNGLGNCNVDVAVTTDGITMNGYTGVIDLNGFSFDTSVGGAATCTFASGTISDTPGTSSVTHTSSGTTRFSGTTFNVPINVTANVVDFDGGTFNAAIVIDNNSTGSPNGAGGCTFNSTFQATNSGSGYFLMGQTSADTFNGDVTLINTSTSRIRMAYQAAGTAFNSNIIVSNTGGGIWIGENGGTSTLASGQTVSLGGTFDANDLRFEGFTQAGGTAQNLSLSGTARLYFDTGSTFSGNIDMDAPRVYINGTTFSGTVDLEKTGASNDASPGGNTFSSTLTLRNSGSGYFLLGNGSADTFSGNVTLLNSGTHDIHLAYNSAGNTLTGNLTCTNTGTGTNDIHISTVSGSSISITGDVTMTHSGSGSGTHLMGDDGDVTVTGNVTMNNSGSGTSTASYVGESGTVSISGSLTMLNDASSTTADMRIANSSSSSVTIGGTTTFTNSGTGTTSRGYLGNQGDITFNGDLTVTNTSGVTNSQVYLHHGSNSSNSYNENIILEVTDAACDGILFGNGTGSGTLAATKTITVGGGGFIAGNLYIRNFTQVGATAQAITATGTTYFRIIDSNWGGNVDFRSPRIRTDGTTYGGTARLEKTGGIGDDASSGGNSFASDTELHNSGSEYFMMGNGSPDTFSGDLLMNNTGSNNMYLGYNSAGNTISGDLTITQAGTGTGSHVYTSQQTGSTLAITGNVDIDITGSSDNLSARLGGNGSVTVGGNVTFDQAGTGTTSQGYIGTNTDGSVSITGTTTITNSGAGTTKRFYGGYQGDVTFGGTLTVTNSASATNSECYFNDQAASSNTYNGNIVMEVTDASCDGIRFGQSTGSGTLAATLTVTVGGGGFIAGDCRFRNFTQVGATAQTVICTGTARIYNYDSNWGGNVDFRAPRMLTRGTTYSGTAILEKTGGVGDDASVGGNSFVGDATLTNSGSGNYFLMGNGSPDTFGANLSINNTGDDHMYIAYNSAGNTVAGDVTITHSTSGTSSTIDLATNSASTLAITGNVTASVTSTAATATLYLANAGTMTVGGDIDVDFNSSGATGNFRSPNTGTLTVTGNFDLDLTNAGTTRNFYLGNTGDLSVGGNFNVTNASTATTSNIYIAYNTTSSLTVTGNTIYTNSGSGTTTRMYPGNLGDCTYTGTVGFFNSSPSTNSGIYSNHGSDAVSLFNNDIQVNCTDASCDGVFFGNSGGSATLAATQTVTIEAAGFIAGDLYFRNFTQTGATDHTLLATGTARIYNYDSDWGGNVDFRAPRMYTRGTTYNGTVILEKTGSVGDDNCAGGNTFVGDATLINSGAGNYFLMGNGSPDTFGGNLVMTNSGQDHMYLAYNSAGNTIAGDFTINHSASGTYSIMDICDQTASTLTVTGNTVYNITASTADYRYYFGSNGDITFNGDFTITDNGSGAQSYGYVANGTNSAVTVAGSTTIDNIGSGTTHRIYVGNNGDITFNGTLDLSNNTTATNNYLYVAQGANSEVIMNGAVTALNAGSNTTARMYLGSSGLTTYNSTLDLTNSASAGNSQTYLNHGGTAVGTYNDNITLAVTDASCDGILFGNGGGTGTLASGQTVTIGGAGYIAGYLYFRNFTQVGGTAQNLAPTGTTRLENYDSEWNGNVDFRSPRHFTRGTTYNGTAFLQKNGSTNDASTGGNTFNGDVTFENTGTSYFMPANGTGNDFNANATYIKSSSGLVYPTYNSTSTYAGNITVESTTQVTFGAGGNGRVQMDGSAAQSINVVGGTPTPRFRDLQTSNASDEITLNTPLEISTELDLDAGNIITDGTNCLYVLNNGIVSSVSDASFVDGPCEKVGNDAFTFPIGKSGVYRYCGISAPSSGSASFRAEYFPVDPAGSYDDTSLDPSIVYISDCEYWIIDRNVSTNSVSVTLSFEGPSPGCSGVDPGGLADLVVARWDGAVWRDHGNGGTTGTSTDGDVVSSAAVTTFSPFTLGTITTINPLPVELIHFEVEKRGDEALLSWTTKSELNNREFHVQRSTNGITFETIGVVEGANNSSEEIHYDFVDSDPYNGLNYYRLKQVDFDGEYEYSDRKSVEFDFNDDFSVYPNPVKDGDVISIGKSVDDDFDEIQLLDASGRLLQLKTTFESESKVQLDLDGLSSGIYLIRIQAGNKIVSKRIVKS